MIKVTQAHRTTVFIHGGPLLIIIIDAVYLVLGYIRFHTHFVPLPQLFLKVNGRRVERLKVVVIVVD